MGGMEAHTRRRGFLFPLSSDDVKNVSSLTFHEIPNTGCACEYSTGRDVTCRDLTVVNPLEYTVTRERATPPREALRLQRGGRVPTLLHGARRESAKVVARVLHPGLWRDDGRVDGHAADHGGRSHGAPRERTGDTRARSPSRGASNG